MKKELTCSIGGGGLIHLGKWFTLVWKIMFTGAVTTWNWEAILVQLIGGINEHPVWLIALCSLKSIGHWID